MVYGYSIGLGFLVSESWVLKERKRENLNSHSYI